MNIKSYNTIIFLVFYQAGNFVLYNAQEETTVRQRLGQINGIVIPKEDSKQNLLRIQKIVYYRDLPGNMRSSDRLNQSNNRTVWLTEEREIICVDSVINHVNIWFLYTYNNQHSTVLSSNVMLIIIVLFDL